MPEKKPKKSTKKSTKKPTSRSAAATGGAPSDTSPPDLERPPSELIVLARPEAALRAHHGELASAAAADVSPLAKVLARHDAALTPLFGVGEERLQREASAFAAFAEAVPPDLSTFYRVDDVAEEDKEQLAEELRELELVEAAYVKPPAEPAAINDQVAAPQEAPPATPDFISRQGYLRPAPGGIDAEYAWTLTGGRGADVRVIDIEGAWRFSHEDLVQNQGGVIGGNQSADLGWRNHGTAVVGVIGADRNSFGVVGIAPDANVRAISIFGLGSAQAIRQAAQALQPGDIILLELHRPGPRFGFQPRGDQRGYIDIEWWPDDYAAVRFATGRGVIVVAAAGNGGEDLDDAIYDNPAPGFPAAWGNPFRRGANDSGSIVVGAGAPPPGTHGRNHGADRSRLGFSNWGAVVDAQGWGREVTTTGYGDLQGGGNEDLWYTDTFSGTSSASPIVVSALAGVQGILRARSRAPLTPARARQCLRTTGSPQQDEPGRPATQRIGNRPDLRQLVRCAIGPIVKVKEHKELKEGKEFKEIKEKDRKELKEWKEFKEKDRKEIKEFKEKERKEIKEKDLKEIREKIRDVFDRDVFQRADVEPDVETDLGERLREVERRVGELSHFIAGELRPDLTHSALRQEGDEDAEALSRELADRAESAKRAKDDKDVEKLREG